MSCQLAMPETLRLTGRVMLNIKRIGLVNQNLQCGVSKQRAGAAPIVSGQVVKNPETIATAIRIGNPASWQQAVAARDQSKGLIDAVTDDEILSAYRKLAAEEGVFVEPSSAAGIAGLIKYQKAGKLPKDKQIVVTVTGNGLKDVQWVLDGAPAPIIVPVDVKRTAEVIGLA
ncbi:MAG: hypothetical protein RL255_388 [Actinomycetota bacterium]